MSIQERVHLELPRQPRSSVTDPDVHKIGHIFGFATKKNVRKLMKQYIHVQYIQICSKPLIHKYWIHHRPLTMCVNYRLRNCENKH